MLGPVEGFGNGVVVNRDTAAMQRIAAICLGSRSVPGTRPYAGTDTANPFGAILTAGMMLEHTGLPVHGSNKRR